jgi:hypothetical protein
MTEPTPIHRLNGDQHDAEGASLTASGKQIVRCSAHCDHGCDLEVDPARAVTDILTAGWIITMWDTATSNHPGVHQVAFCDMTCMLIGWVNRFTETPDGCLILARALDPILDALELVAQPQAPE